MCIIVLAVLLAVYLLKERKRKINESFEAEESKETGDGVDYEQSPEREALTAEERQAQKELLM